MNYLALVVLIAVVVAGCTAMRSASQEGPAHMSEEDVDSSFNETESLLLNDTDDVELGSLI